MKRTSRVLAVLIALIMTVSAFSLTLYAEGEKPKLENDNILNVWNDEIIGAIKGAGTPNQTDFEVTEEGLLVKYTGGEEDSSDPFFTLPILSIYRKFDAPLPTPENSVYMVFKVKASPECDGGFEVFAKPVQGDSGVADYEPNDEWELIFVDMYFTSLAEDRRVSSVRVDWSANNTLPGASMIIASVAFFGDENEAFDYIDKCYQEMDPNYEPPTEAPTTAPTEKPTDAPTEPATEAPTDPETEPGKSGCSGLIAASGVAVILTAAAAAVALKKR